MFQELLFKLSKVSVPLNGRIEEEGDSIINTIIFWKKFSGDVFEYKILYFKKLRRKEQEILKIQKLVYNSEITLKEKNILLQEIENRLLKLEFLRYIYNTEAHKIDDRIQVYYPYSIDIYNKAFFGVTKKNVDVPHVLGSPRNFVSIYKKSDLVHLIARAKVYCPDLIFKFWKYPNFSHSNGVLKIPNQKHYNIQNIITLFFHETTHFFRTYNGNRNLWFTFQFAWYSSLEEGIAIYNEYKYGNKVCDYGNYVPYYNLCIWVLLKHISEEEKKEKIYEILSHKWFNRERSYQYYNRFYKYCELWWTYIFLKDLIYYNGYKNVKRLIRLDPTNYEKIMAWDIGIQELQQWIVWVKNSYDYEKFFKSMLQEIKIIQKNK